MTRAILTLMILVPATVLAQDIAPRPNSGNAGVIAVGATSAAPAQRATAAPSAASTSVRRPSMVGYIDDARVESHLRLRFDAASNSKFPDRAEFFYAKCGCYQGLAPLIPPAYDPNAPGPGPGVPTSLNFQQLLFEGEYAPISRLSLFAEIPARWLQPQAFKPIPPFAPFGNESGLGDIRAGAKLAVVSSSTTSLTVQVRGYAPSGSASKGLGTNHWSVEPALLYYQQVGDRLSIESQIGDWHPTGGSAGVPTASSDRFSGDVIFYGVGPSYEIYQGQAVRFAPVVELVGWNVRGGFQTAPGGALLGAADEAEGTNIVNLKIGGRFILRDRSSFYAGFGHVLTDSAWYRNIVRIEYRYAF